MEPSVSPEERRGVWGPLTKQATEEEQRALPDSKAAPGPVRHTPPRVSTRKDSDHEKLVLSMSWSDSPRDMPSHLIVSTPCSQCPHARRFHRYSTLSLLCILSI